MFGERGEMGRKEGDCEGMRKRERRLDRKMDGGGGEEGKDRKG